MKFSVCMAAYVVGAGYCSDSDQGDFTESDDEGEDGYRKGGSTASPVSSMRKGGTTFSETTTYLWPYERAAQSLEEIQFIEFHFYKRFFHSPN